MNLCPQDVLTPSRDAETYVSKMPFLGAVVAVHGGGALGVGAGHLDRPWLCLKHGNRQELGLAVFRMLN